MTSITIDKLFESSSKQIKSLENELAIAGFNDRILEIADSERSESSLEIADIGFTMMAGLLGGVLNNNKWLHDTLESYHNDSAAYKPKSKIGKILHHKGDYIDKFPTENGKMYVNRDFQESTEVFGFHRLFFGHDIFSLSKDNPLYVLVGQYGFLKGILQVVRHLLADTFSKNGLPLPFSSWLDYEKEGKLSNWIKTWSEQMSKGSSLKADQVYERAFTIHMHDVLTQGLTFVLCLSYIWLRGVSDEFRKSQIKIVAYTACFYTNCFTGIVKYGVPYVNWPTLSMLLKELFHFARLNYKDLKRLEKITDALTEKNVSLENTVMLTGSSLVSYQDGTGYIAELDKGFDSLSKLTDGFDEEDF
jgi:hypothetical protein